MILRRKFIAGLAGAAAWPAVARAQQPDDMARIGVLMNLSADDAEGQARMTAFLQEVQVLGWTHGRNARIDYRWGASDAERIRKSAAELLALAPSVIVASGAAAAATLQQKTRIVPIVFAQAADPVGTGLVASLARPGGNITGFTSFEHGFSAKWLQLLKQVAPRVTRVAVLRDPTYISQVAQFSAIQAVAPLLGAELTPIDVRSPLAVERDITEFVRGPTAGLIVTSSASAIIHRDIIIALAARHRLPAIYPLRHFVTDGGLISYGPDTIDQFRRAAGYVDRILKGEQPANLPVQAPTKYETVLNLKTAKALGLTIPETLLATADQVIE
jgi:putative tryptophan/tyrosine transport system substrate-binding protein